MNWATLEMQIEDNLKAGMNPREARNAALRSFARIEPMRETTGRSLDNLYASDDNRKLCSSYLSIMDRMGDKLDHFGDAETRLERL